MFYVIHILSLYNSSPFCISFFISHHEELYCYAKENSYVFFFSYIFFCYSLSVTALILGSVLLQKISLIYIFVTLTVCLSLSLFLYLLLCVCLCLSLFTSFAISHQDLYCCSSNVWGSLSLCLSGSLSLCLFISSLLCSFCLSPLLCLSYFIGRTH